LTRAKQANKKLQLLFYLVDFNRYIKLCTHIGFEYRRWVHVHTFIFILVLRTLDYEMSTSI